MVFFSFADASVAAAAAGDCRWGWQTDKQGRRLEVQRGARLLALLRAATDGATEILLALQDVLRPVSFPSRSADFFYCWRHRSCVFLVCARMYVLYVNVDTEDDVKAREAARGK
jgi:hypothetical protein